MPQAAIYRFDGVTVDVPAMRVCRGTVELALEPKSFRLLQLLIENRERVVTKDEIFGAVWGDSFVSDNSLTRAVAQIRKALDDDPRKPKYIDTVPTVGYRFIAALESAPAVPAAAGPTAVVEGKKRRVPALPLALGLAVVLAAVWVAFRMSRPKPVPASMLPPRLTSLTTYRGNEDNPSFSPDGEEIAFDWDGDKQDNTDIYVKRLPADAPPRRLTTDPAPDIGPTWSPDGKWIAFERRLTPDRTALMLIPAAGGPEKKIGEFPVWLDKLAPKPVWSRNGRWLIFPVASGNGSTLFRVSPTTGEARPIFPVQQSLGTVSPTLSPDGTILAYVLHPQFNAGELWFVHVDADLNALDVPYRPLKNPAPIWLARWLPNGKQLLIWQAGTIFRVSADGTSELQPETDLLLHPYGLEISQRGDRLAYVSFRGDANIWRLDLKAKAARPERLIASTARDVYPEYSPDGKKITFHSSRTGIWSEVWVADADGGNERQLTSFGNGISGTAHWSPDGKTISFDSNASGHYQIYTMDANGGNLKQWTHDSSEQFGNSWSRDEKWIYYTSRVTGENELWKLPVAGGPAVQVTHSGGWMATESADGKWLYYCKDTESGSIWRMPVDGGPEEQIVGSLYRNNFAVTTGGIYYEPMPGVDGNTSILFYDLAKRKSRLVLQIGTPEYGLALSPDGRYLVYAQLDDKASDLMMVENFH